MRDGAFTAERLLALYDRVAEAEDAIPRLRRFVLDLAVRGKLVEQDASDEPAAELLKRIAGSAAQQPARRGKQRDTSAANALEELPFDAPDGWTFAALGQLVRVLNGRAYKQQELLSSGTPVLRVGNLFTSNHWYYSDLELDDDKYCEAGDLIYAWSASFGPFIWDGPRAIFHYHIWKLPLISEADLSKWYLFLFLQQKTREIKEAGHGISMVHMTKEKMEKLIVPLPPLAEQRRIVAKVNELMALCDRLEGARAMREAVRDRLTAATLTRLTAPEIDAETFPIHARFALQTLPTLTTRPDQIKTLRQTILNLAVRGKLVPQDPTEEPAAELLKRIGEERVAKAKGAKVRAKRPVPFADQTSIASLPDSWRIEAIGNLVDPTATISYGVLVPGPDVTDGIPFVRAQDLALSGHPERPNKTIAPEIEAPYARTRLRGGEILLCVVGSIGKLGVAPQSWAGANIARAVARIAPVESISSDYLLLAMRSDLIQTYCAEATRTLAQPTLNVGLIEVLPIPLPPLAEQHRIVAKVDALMSLCDQLEASLTTTTTTRSRLLEALLHEALGGAPGAQAEAAA
ncbi:restriction endonuclease subunit S [Rhodobacter lacus]|uniref:Restriction endonuclease subunit S n=1 Tax=Rhodobacter lacus TaxID=1641972 RepID=A0ABW5A9M9_9RHOB